MFGLKNWQFLSEMLELFRLKTYLFFFPRLFDRRTFSSKDCFTGQSPGIGHDASHLYTGGSRMCRGEGQVQAGLLTKGLEVCCSGGAGDFSEDLTDGRGIAVEVVAAR